MILGVDAGNEWVKVCGPHGLLSFSAAVGEWRERNLKNAYLGDEMEFEYNGRRGFAGSLAKLESDWATTRKGNTKAHEDAKLRVLLALHRYGVSNEYDIVTLQPIATCTKEQKAKIKQNLVGVHTMSVNGVTRTFTVRKVEVAPEGAIGALADVQEGVSRIIDVGSGTVNLATVIGVRNADGKLILRFVDADSSTVSVGMGTTRSELSGMARGIANEALQRWQPDDRYRLIGGGAEPLLSHLQKHLPHVEVIVPKITLFHSTSNRLPMPIYANAVGAYELGKQIYGA